MQRERYSFGELCTLGNLIVVKGVDVYNKIYSNCFVAILLINVADVLFRTQTIGLSIYLTFDMVTSTRYSNIIDDQTSIAV